MPERKETCPLSRRYHDLGYSRDACQPRTIRYVYHNVNVLMYSYEYTYWLYVYE